MKETMSFESILGFTITFSGFWIFLYSTIIEFTTENPNHEFLMLYGLVHYLVTIILILFFTLLYTKGLIILNSSSPKINLLYQIILNWAIKNWIYFVLAPIAALFLIKASIHIPIVILIALSFSVGLILNIPKWVPKFNHYKRLSTSLGQQIWIKIFESLVLIAGFIIFIVLISFVSSDASIITDKSIYKHSDDILLNIRRKGYILLPTIKSIKLNNSIPIFPSEANKTIPNQAYSLNFKNNDLIYENFIEVQFEPQILTIEKKAYKLLAIAP